MITTARAPLVWVTGARGMLGRALVRRLAARGHDVVATGREVDVADRAAVQTFAATLPRALGCVFNAAGYTAVDAAEAEPARAFAVNADGVAHVAEVARAHGAALVHVSSDYVFGAGMLGTDGAADVPALLTEDAATGPLNVYGASKLAGERRALAHAGAAGEGAGEGARTIVVRTSWLFGDGPCFVARMLELMAERVELTVVDDQHGRPTAADDLADALVAFGVGALAAAPSGVYHFANAGVVTWYGFALAIRDAALRHGHPVVCARVRAVSSAAFARPARRPAWSALDTARFEALAGAPIRSWRAALDAHVAALARGPVRRPP